MNSMTVLYTRQVLKIAAVLLLSIFVIRMFIFEMGRINGRSMESTLVDEQMFIVNKLPLLIRQPKRGDVVQFFDPNDDTLLVKRIVGLPGEQIKISKNVVSVIDANGNETLIDEPYLDANEITDSATGETITYSKIPQHSYYVLGDNREASTDSRHFGAIGRYLITGKITGL